MEIVKCTECESKNQLSEVVIRTIHTKPIEQKVYYDMQGIKHIHNPDVVIAIYICSYTHVWYVMNYSHCPNPDCGWSSKSLMSGET